MTKKETISEAQSIIADILLLNSEYLENYSDNELGDSSHVWPINKKSSLGTRKIHERWVELHFRDYTDSFFCAPFRISETRWWASQYLNVHRSMHVCSPTSREFILLFVIHFCWHVSASLVLNELYQQVPCHKITQYLSLHDSSINIIFVHFSTSIRHQNLGELYMRWE